MNRHIALDRCLLLTIRWFGKPFFTESICSMPFEDHLRAVRIHLPELQGTGYYDADVDTSVGRLPLRLHVLHASDASRPLVIYNMGGGESPFDRGARRIFPLDQALALNVVAIEAPLQRSVRQLSKAFARLDNYLAMLAATVAMNEHVLQSTRFGSAAVKVIAGTSLGGFVANRHHLAFGSASAYVPFVAGTRHGEIFLTTIASGAAARNDPGHIRDRLNFDDAWARTRHPNVFPVLGRFDQLNRLEVQGPSYGDTPLDIWQGGHLYNSLHPQRSLHKILDVADRVSQRTDNAWTGAGDR
jgi:hypothetical protein